MDMDLQTGMAQDDSMFGIDNVGLDFNDFEILNGKIPADYFPLYDGLLTVQISCLRLRRTLALSSVCPPPPT